MAEAKRRAQLLQKIDDHFDGEELRRLCFHLDIQYDNLPGRAKNDKALELIELCKRSGRLAELIDACQKQRPNVVWSYEVRFFVSYKRHAPTDQTLALFLHDFLSRAGHHVFIDQTMRTGTAWLETIDRQIQAADFLIVLLSKASADSEMVRAEIHRAYDYGKQQGHPAILPVRMAYKGLLPYAIDAFLNPLQYVVWDSPADDERVGQKILGVVAGELPEQEPVKPVIFTAERSISEDGRVIAADSSPAPPLPEFDPRILDELTAPGGAVRLSDRFYIEREGDAAVKREIARPGTLCTIRAARQSGKSSLLARAIHHASQQGAVVVNMDLQQPDSTMISDQNAFLHYLAELIARKLRLDAGALRQAWSSSLGPQDKLTFFLEDVVLPVVPRLLVLALDESDKLLETKYYTDFFGLVRSWYNQAALNPLWEKLNIVLVISTEPYLLIDDPNQSPFNVGLKLYLKDFSESQVQELNQRHGGPVAPADFSSFMALFGGHPYLIREALYTLVMDKLGWKTFVASAATDQGPFSDHLRRQLWLLRDGSGLRQALRQVVYQNRCDDTAARFRLLQAGLIKGAGEVYTCRCDLYRLYFEDKLK
jgi:hypothetical protein